MIIIAATVSIYLSTGGTDGSPGASVDIDALGPPTLRFKQADDSTIDSNNPMPIPTSGTNYSRFKQIYLYCDVAPSTQIDNLKFYTDGAGFGTGITVNVGDQFPVHNSGATTGYNVSDLNEVITNHSSITSATDAFTFTSGSPLSGPTISETGSIIDAVGETSNYLVLSMEVGTTASSGDLTDETFTIQFDEI